MQLQAAESVLVRRDNVIRFLIARALMMLLMVVGFWLAIRSSL